MFDLPAPMNAETPLILESCGQDLCVYVVCVCYCYVLLYRWWYCPLLVIACCVCRLKAVAKLRGQGVCMTDRESEVQRKQLCSRTNGVNTNGAAAKVMNLPD